MNVALISWYNYEKIVLLKKGKKKIEEVTMERIPVGRELRQEGGIGVERRFWDAKIRGTNSVLT